MFVVLVFFLIYGVEIFCKVTVILTLRIIFITVFSIYLYFVNFSSDLAKQLSQIRYYKFEPQANHRAPFGKSFARAVLHFVTDKFFF